MVGSVSLGGLGISDFGIDDGDFDGDICDRDRGEDISEPKSADHSVALIFCGTGRRL